MLGYGGILKMLVAFGTDCLGSDLLRSTFCCFVHLHAIIGLLRHGISILLILLLCTSTPLFPRPPNESRGVHDYRREILANPP